MMYENKEIKKILEQVIALEKAIKYIYESDTSNVWRFSGFNTFVTKYNLLAKKTATITKDDGFILIFDEEKIGTSYNTLAMTQKNIFDSLLANVLTLRSLLENKINYSESEVENVKNFIQTKLRAAMFEKPEKEKDVQDRLEQLFIGRGYSKGTEYDREVGRVKVSSKEVVPDFIFPRFSLALEVKLCKDQVKFKALIDEINADIQSYSKSYDHILFVIYDLGFIRNEIEFKNGLDDGYKVSVVIVKN